MANAEHEKKLVDYTEREWNAWRAEHPEETPDLSKANLGHLFPAPNVSGFQILPEGEGYDLSNANFRDANLDGAHLSGTNLTGANFQRAILSGAILYGAKLDGADFTHAILSDAKLNGLRMPPRSTFSRADLVNATLTGARFPESFFDGAKLHGAVLTETVLTEANFSKAELANANLHKADLTGANLREADLRGANLSGAILNGADLNLANLSDADLTDVKGLELDDTRILHARFSASANDKWSILRRKYTGPNMILTLLFAFLFFAPLLVKAAAFSVAGETQQRIVTAANQIDGVSLRLDCASGGAITGSIMEHKVNMPCAAVPAWKLLLGLGGPLGWIMPLLTLTLIVYQLLRYGLTIQVSRMRDAEERSGISPSKYGVLPYPFLYRVHRVVSWLFWISLAALAVRAAEFLSTDVITQVGVAGS